MPSQTPIVDAPAPRLAAPGAPPSFAVVAIGASSGGLDATRALLAELPSPAGFAVILVQHLEPTHRSMMVDLLTSHTGLVVVEAQDGVAIEAEHLYVIPPGRYLTVADGRIAVERPPVRHGPRLPFDYLLASMAQALAGRAVAVVLSGTGADGSSGIAAIKARGGTVLVQDPDEAGFDGMPRSAILTGHVDRVCPLRALAGELMALGARLARMPPPDPQAGPATAAVDLLDEIIALLRSRTVHDFTLYKHGTLQRRIARRIAMAAIEPHDMAAYLRLLRDDPNELDELAKDLLINVTSFFRDAKVFAMLADSVIPDLLARALPDQTLRFWIAGCSTGEEAYSLAMILIEAVAAIDRPVKLQIFASDVDPDAIAAAREGLYPNSILAEISPERVARFFVRDEKSFRVTPELRAAVVFTVQDLLADPPFSRIDFVSCRNLMIYLGPEAQARVLSIFHFALCDKGLLLLGNAETIGSQDSHFEVVSKPERLFRHVGRARPGELGFSMTGADGPRIAQKPRPGSVQSRQAALAELCQRLVLENFAPAAVLVDRKLECLFSLGPTERYLHVAPGFPSHDLLAMTAPGLRIKLRAAIQQATQTNAPATVPGGRLGTAPDAAAFSICVQPVAGDRQDLMLVCFVDEPRRQAAPGDAPLDTGGNRAAELERELATTKVELQAAIRNLEISGEEQKVVNEEALSTNEEYQSTNEELLTSKEELQSLNEELTALNSQLHETLERQRTSSNDLQNILYSIDAATIFLDTDLNIRFFTPATKSLFNVIPGDVGRPLADLNSLAANGALLGDARTVMRTQLPIEREIEAQSGAWYIRRILPYRTKDHGVEGVVITFADITERRHTADALRAAKRQAELASIAKSRFLAAASHDLRQPLQTLTLLQGLLAKTVQGEKARRLVARFDDTLDAMVGMLNTLLDINQIEAGTVRADRQTVPINDLLARMRDEFTLHARAQGLQLTVVPCSLSIDSDPRLLEQMVRNLLSNALKYTKQGKVLLGCRRRGSRLSIEIWDTGIGIAGEKLQAIFEEYHQIDNAARERSRGLGLGLGLAIVQRLATLLDHRIAVRSNPGKGSMFSIEVGLVAPILPLDAGARPLAVAPLPAGDDTPVQHRSGSVLVIEDDPEVRELLQVFLQDEGHRPTVAADGLAALELVSRGAVRPDLVLADYNLPKGLDGVQLSNRLRERLQSHVPVIILTGDISAETLHTIAHHDCTRLSKPVHLNDLRAAIQGLLGHAAPLQMTPRAGNPPPSAADAGQPIIYLVDDNDEVRRDLRMALEEDGRDVEDFGSCEAFLAAYQPDVRACLLIDAYLPGMSGLELLQRLAADGALLPSIMITGRSDVPMAVAAMKAGARDFIEKPISHAELLQSIARALEQAEDQSKLVAWREQAATHVATLTPRQREIMAMVLAGHPSKNIAADLGISQRTVENHRATIMRRMGTKSLPALARLALAAGE